MVRRALELGVNVFDTSPLYGTEEIVGVGLGSVREDVVVSTKVSPSSAKTVRTSVEKSLSRLRTDYVDILLLHGVAAGAYRYCVEEVLPELERLKRERKTRFVGLTEAFGDDPEHTMLAAALQDDCWDCIMFGYNPTNRSAVETVLPLAREQAFGTLIMRAARDTGSQTSEKLQVMDACYRFSARAPGVHVVLTGTGSRHHLADNVASISGAVKVEC